MRLTVLENYAHCALEDPCPPAEAGRQTVGVVAAARARRASRLLVDLRALAPAGVPGLEERYALGSEIARAGRGARQIAFVLRPEALAPYEFTFVVSSNRGLPAAGFVTEAEALVWLLGAPGGNGGAPVRPAP